MSSCVAILPSLILTYERRVSLQSYLLLCFLLSLERNVVRTIPFSVLKLGTADGKSLEKAHLTFEIVYLNVLPWPF